MGVWGIFFFFLLCEIVLSRVFLAAFFFPLCGGRIDGLLN